jgi:hypothetical protein
MIKYVKRKNLDLVKYNDCIENSIQSRIYAFAWYLDIVADNWDVLVLNDYQAVMPIPWKQKYFIKYITQPFFCQQLGVFSKDEISNDVIQNFIKVIPIKFLKITLNFNSKNAIDSKDLIIKNNAILKLDKDFKELKNNFNKNRKRDLKKAELSLFTFDTAIQSNEFFDFYLENDKNYKAEKKLLFTLKKIITSSNLKIKYFGLRHNGALSCSVLLLDDGKRVTYLVPVSNNFSRENGGATFLISKILSLYAKRNYILDFEGSMIAGVAKFYRSFGAKEAVYFTFNRTFL